MLKDFQPAPQADKHSFTANCAPDRHTPSQAIFSCGIFKWVPTKTGKGIKKSAVIHRVIGPVSKPDLVYFEAQRLCRKLDGGWTPCKKSSKVKSG